MHPPAVTELFERQHFGLGHCRATPGAGAAQKPLMQGRDVDVLAVHVIEPGSGIALADQRLQTADSGLVELFEIALGAQLVVQLLHRGQLIFPRDEQGAARRQDRAVGKALGRAGHKGCRSAGQRPDRRRPVDRREQRRRPPGGVVAGLGLAFEQHHLAVRRQRVGRRSTGYAGTNHDYVCAGHVAHRRRPSLKLKRAPA